jgi:two-component system CheB/CheR fusion protein
LTPADHDPGRAGTATPSDAVGEASSVLDFTARAKLAFPVVGIGASAGGVEALRKFFAAASPASGMAYIVIQHLSPEHESLMAEILGHCTPMPVRQIDDGMRVEPNHVYVIRPGHTITLADGALHLGEPVEKRGHRRPIDDFFRSLAQEQGQHAVAVLLSGTGTNGTAGAQAIKAVGGLCVAQSPDTAEFPGMPQSLIQAGLADQILEPEAIPAVLQRYTRQPYLARDPAEVVRTAQELERHRDELNEVIAIVRARTGHDFNHYKVPTVLRRIQRRMGLFSITELKDYSIRLREKPDEVAALAADLMINVTGFFRDPAAWEALREAVVRPLVEQADSGGTLRAWVAACASGEEPYTLAMLIAEEAERARKDLKVKIFATDTADKSLSFARAGVYPGGIEGDLSPERLEKFFDKDEHVYRVKKSLRDQIVFAPQDVLRDPPFSHIDIVTCRNLLIYLEPQAQRRTLALLHFALRDGGYLLLGNAESLGHAETLFEVVSKRWRIYRRGTSAPYRVADLTNPTAHLAEARFPAQVPPTTIGRPSSTLLVQLELLEKFAPPTVVVDGNERILYFHGDPEPYLQHPSGESTHNLLEAVRPALRAAVRQVLRQAIAERHSVAVEIEFPDGARPTRITAGLLSRRQPEHFHVSFEPLGAQGASEPSTLARQYSPEVLSAARAHETDFPLEEEVRVLRRELQTSMEAFEVTHEELKAANEEVTSINEELQSTNEELETGKEELQSLNEELVTVNTQLQGKVLELEALTNDLDNLLSSTDIAVVFLDTRLCVRRFTPAVSDLLQLIAADVGRPLQDLAQKFSGGDLIAAAAQVLSKLSPHEHEVHSHSGRWYLQRLLPYRGEDNGIAGVVITFVEITARKHAEQAITAIQERLQAIIEQLPAAVLMVEKPSGKLILANLRAAQLFNQPFPLPLVGQHRPPADSMLHGFHQDGRAYESHEWPLSRALATGEAILDEEIDFVRFDGTRLGLAMSASPVRNSAGVVVGAVAAFWDITARQRSQAALRESEERFRLLVESAHDYAIFMLDPQGNVLSWNSGAERLTGHREQEIIGQSGAALFTTEDRAAGLPEREIRLAAESGRALDERWHLRKDGTRFWASGVMTPARDAQGKLRGFVKIMRDQTERRGIDARLQEALQSAQQLRVRAEGANRAKDEFISTVSHELRTPLNTIRLWSRMLVSGTVQGEDVVKGGQIIDRAALAQQQLIDDLLDVSRIATGYLRLVMRDTRMTDAIEGAIDAIRPLAESHQIALTIDLSDQVGVVRIDPDRIQQVVWNVLANAVKFTPERGGVEVRSRRVEGTVEIEISDTGVGISPEFLPHVFDRFRQADASSTRRHGGLGLGLAIAKQLVELHGGTIGVRSEGEGRGATFTIYLPLERHFVASGEGPVEAPPRDRLRGIRVLLVEDESMAREATARLLEQSGAQVRGVSSAAQAREALASQRPDVIVADIGMAGEDGYTLLAGLRRTEQAQSLPRLPAIAVTAFARSEDRQRALSAGFDEHLPKPVEPEQLIHALMKLARAR